MSVVLLLACLVYSGAPASAHAGFVGGDPGSGEILSKGPGTVRVTFNEPVEAEFDPLRVTGQDGERVDGEDARVSTEDARVVEASLGELTSGTYTVEYRVTSVDGHVIAGDYEFEVSSPAEETAQETSAEPTAVEPAPQETTGRTLPETEPASEESGPLGSYALIGLLVLGLAVAAVIATRRSGGSR